jgi:predicted transcriptional regulator
MEERKTRAGSFTAYMEAELKRQQTPRARSGAPALSLLGVLAGAEDKQLPVTELMSKSGMEFLDYAEALKSLEAAGMIDLDRTTPQEFVSLTPKGQEVALLSRPG